MLNRILCLAALIATPLFGKGHYEATDPYFSERFNARNFLAILCGFEVNVDLLYWKPNGTQLDWVALREDQGELPDITLQYHDFDNNWTPGFRASLLRSDFFHGLGLDLRYTYLGETTRKHLETDVGYFVSPFFHQGILYAQEGSPIPNQADATHHFYYHGWDALVNSVQSFETSPLSLHHFAGVAGFVLDQKFESTLIDDDVAGHFLRHKWKSFLTTLGMKVGTKGEYKMTSVGSLYCSLSGMLFAGQHKGSTRHLLALPDEEDWKWNFYEPRTNRFLIPGIHLGLGFDYRCCLGKLNVVWSAGYELLKYWNMPAIRTFSGWDTEFYYTETTMPDIGSFGFHGFTLGMGVQF